jgi:hypothetical protein
MAKTRFFRIAIEGGTTDGRVIERAWIEQMAADYNPATYTARINCEHLRGYSPEPPFNSYGSVTALKAEPVQLEIGGKKQTRLALLAQLDPNEQLLAINSKQQKLFTSCEISTDMGGTKRAGLVGLAVTDNPASLGTEMLEFAAKQSVNPFAARKTDPTNLFSAATEATIELEAETPPAPSEAQGFFAAATEFFKALKGEPAKDPATPPPPPPAANDNDARFAAVLSGVEKLAAGIEAMGKDLQGSITKLRGDHDALKASIETTDGDSRQRPPATGGGNYARADF